MGIQIIIKYMKRRLKSLAIRKLKLLVIQMIQYMFT